MFQVIRDRINHHQNEEIDASNTVSDGQPMPTRQTKKAKAEPRDPVLGSLRPKFLAWELDHIGGITQCSQSSAFRNSYCQLLAYLKEQSHSDVFPIIENNENFLSIAPSFYASRSSLIITK